MSYSPQVLFLVTFSSVFVLRLRADDTSHDNLGIIGGYAASIEDNPFIVSLCKYETGFCGGSIVHERFILTAAHCVVRQNRNVQLQVRMGSDRHNSGGVLIDVEDRLCHEGYKNHNHDICLLKLIEPVQFGQKVDLVDLADEDSEFEDGLMVNVTGWGNTKMQGKKYPETLLQTMVPLLSDEHCREIYPAMTEEMLCAGAERHDACDGDSGGPLTYDNIQIGVVSFGDGCGVNAGVYTRVSRYLNWINTTIEENL